MVETRERPLSLSYRRPSDRSERRVLQEVLDGLHHDPQSDLAEVGSGFGLGLISLLFIGPVALLVAWLLQFATGVTFGSDQAWLAAAALWLAGWSGMSAVKVAARRGRASALRRAITADIAEGDVQEESWRFVEAIGFQEAEKMPLLYLVQADNGRIVAFEETRLTGRERQPGEGFSSAAPADAVLVRGIRSGVLISENYSGPTLPLVDVQPLALPRDERPPHGSVVDRPWGAVGPWLSGRSTVA
ncbi:hypothetical protein [Phreatobacter oligotrophus]|uniref:Uncharacterized protein n=1 Tax=Phreatobacter oligotrophus TaxID=1122261 RepID=A0A2T4ZHU6_9HYPH|nr:hypothetical protein [Phreatobacter oligotrophus]PTM61533.1 hypothetical protein C8P69_101203 [Phreatobacter oligotrophus]